MPYLERVNGPVAHLMRDNEMKPTELYDAVMDALKSRPRRNLCTPRDLGLIYADTVSALATCGIKLTDTQIKRLHWSDEIRTLWDEVEYVIERHYAQRGMKVIWPSRGEELRVIPKQRRAA